MARTIVPLGLVIWAGAFEVSLRHGCVSGHAPHARKEATHQVTFCFDPTVQESPAFGLVTGGTKTSRTASGRAETTARTESAKVKTESCMTDVNTVFDVVGDVEERSGKARLRAGEQEL